jgi:hypothetical protein
MMSGPEAVASLLSASESVSAWRYGEMVSSDVKRLKALESENNRLKK